MTARRQKRTQVDRRQEAELRILDAALALVAERGSLLMTLADIGERAGYSRALPAHYFGNKEGLVTSLANYMVERFRRIFVRSPKPREGLPAILGRVDAYICGAAEEPAQFRALQVLLAEASTESGGAALRESLIHANRRALLFFEHQIKVAIARGEVRANVDPAASSRVIVGAMRGVLSQWFLDPADCDLERCRLELLEMVRLSLAAPGPTPPANENERA